MIRKMTLQEYSSFYQYSVNEHAEELMQEMNISFDEAYSQAEAEVKEMLPNGLDTQDNYLMVIEDETDGRSVGVLWYLYEETDGVKQVFLCDFVIKEHERRKGYATVALKEMQEHAAEYGCEESVLFVSKDNSAAIELYAQNGYASFREFEYGIYMKKHIV